MESRTERILDTARRKVGQGFDVNQQYAAVNAARDKRRRRGERNLKRMLAGGFRIPILKP
jgi:hypothetical protein